MFFPNDKLWLSPKVSSVSFLFIFLMTSHYHFALEIVTSWLLGLLAEVLLELLQRACQWTPRSSGPVSLSFTNVCLLHHCHYWLTQNFSFSVMLKSTLLHIVPALMLTIYLTLATLLDCSRCPFRELERSMQGFRFYLYFQKVRIHIKVFYLRMSVPRGAGKYL